MAAGDHAISLRMSRFVRSIVQGMAPYVPGEQPQGGGFVKLNTNENPYPPSPKVIDALRHAIDADLRLYPDPTASKLRARAAEVYGVEVDQIIAGNGSDELLSLIIRACVGEGDRVAYATPTYSLYDTLVTIEEGEIVTFPYGVDWSLPAGLAAAQAKVTFVCHPNAPSGVAAPMAHIEALAKAVSGVLVVDEAYVDFGEESAMGLVGRYDNLIVLRTFSKSFSLAGMRIGLAFGSKDLVADLGKVKDSYNLNRLSIIAATAALEDYEWMKTAAERVKATRSRLTAALRARGFTVPDSQTNFVLARRPGESQEGRYLALKEKRVLVRYFRIPELQDALRITVGTDSEIDALIDSLDQTL